MSLALPETDVSIYSTDPASLREHAQRVQRNFERVAAAWPMLIFIGSGSPNGAVTASPGALYVSTAGGAGTTLYVKESGVGTSAGWVGK